MFPSTKSVPHKRSSTFDPIAECVALPAQKKKKASRAKPVSIQVILLPKLATLIVPKGKRRQGLSAERRIESIKLVRTASALEVQNSVVRAFQGHSLCEWEYLEVNAGHLIVSSCQNPGGEIVDRRGGLYLREKERNESQVS